MAPDDTIRSPHATLPWRIAARKAGSTAKPTSNPTDGKITLSSRRVFARTLGFFFISDVFRTDELRSDRTASQLLSWREAARITRYQTCTAHYFSMRNLPQQKFPAIWSARGFTYAIAPKLNINVDYSI